ncbi:MAG: hypothetical protein PVJ57_10750 [Phycisphaerae bacterium]
MRRGTLLRVGGIVVAGALFIGGTGCRELLIGTNIASVATGWLLGNLTTSGNVERVCYQNGVLIDCADLPEDLGLD